MRELIGRVELDDSDTASALRAIDHFDRLVEERASTAAVVRAAAAMAGCPAGLADASRGVTRRYAASGSPLSEAVHPRPGLRVAIPNRPGSWVWLERTGQVGALDQLIAERAARAVHALLGDSSMPLADTAVRIVCNVEASDVDRKDACSRLGIAGPVTVLVTTTTHADLGVHHSATSGPHIVYLLTGTPLVPSGARAGVAFSGEPLGIAAAFEHARVALRLTDRVGGPGPSVVNYSDLGALAAVADAFTPQRAGDVDDVRRLDELFQDRLWVIDTIQAVVQSTTLRQAATVLHVHHSTLQERLKSLDSLLGYDMLGQGGRQRSAVTLLLWRIANFDAMTGARMWH